MGGLEVQMQGNEFNQPWRLEELHVHHLQAILEGTAFPRPVNLHIKAIMECLISYYDMNLISYRNMNLTPTMA